MFSRTCALCTAVLFTVMSIGALPANAAIITGTALLNGANEVPPTGSGATGVANWQVDTTTDLISINVAVNGIFLSSITFPSGTGLEFGALGPFHIHNAPPGVNGPIIVPFPSASFYTPTATGLTITASGIGFPTASLLSPLRNGDLYFNLHTLSFPSGEIRGQLQIPAPATLPLAFSGLLIMGALARRRIKTATEA